MCFSADEACSKYFSDQKISCVSQVAKLKRPIVIGFKKVEAAAPAKSNSLLFFCACDDTR